MTSSCIIVFFPLVVSRWNCRENVATFPRTSMHMLALTRVTLRRLSQVRSYSLIERASYSGNFLNCL